MPGAIGQITARASHPIEKVEIPSIPAAIVAFRYTIQGGDGNDFTVTMPQAVSTPYEVCAGVVLAQVGGVDVFVEIKTPDSGGDRTTTTFRVLTSAALDAGSLLSFIVAQRSGT